MTDIDYKQKYEQLKRDYETMRQHFVKERDRYKNRISDIEDLAQSLFDLIMNREVS